MIGIDFGTTNSAVAMADKFGHGTTARDPSGDTESETFRSILFFATPQKGMRRELSAYAGPEGAHIIKDGRRGLRARPLDHKGGATHPVDHGKARDPRLHSEFCPPAFPCPAKGACGLRDGRRRTRRAAASGAAR